MVGGVKVNGKGEGGCRVKVYVIVCGGVEEERVEGWGVRGGGVEGYRKKKEASRIHYLH